MKTTIHRGPRPKKRLRHAGAYAPDGSRWFIPPFQLCDGQEGSLAVGDEYVTCPRCKTMLANGEKRTVS